MLARLRLTTCDNADPKAFVQGGGNVAAMISARLRGLGREVESLSAILEFGCGCGRVARHWADLRGPEVHGCDANGELVEWCAENLPFLRMAKNELEPPLPYEAEKFDLVYSISVFTHLPVASQLDWAAELGRVLKPGGMLFATFHGDSHAQRFLLPAELRRYRANQPVGVFEQLSGSNGCATFNPRADVEDRLLADFDMVAFVSSQDHAKTFQDLYIGQRRSDS